MKRTAKPKTKAQLVAKLRAVINRATPTDPWTDDWNETWDEDLTDQDIVEEIIRVLGPEIEELDKAKAEKTKKPRKR